MKLNMFKRSMIFTTFFGSCLSIALIVASFGTIHWIDARAKRTTNTLDSEGLIIFGLFGGQKELDVGYGRRLHDIGIKSGTLPARRWAWCGTTALLLASLTCAVCAALLSALASANHIRCSPRPMLVCNCLAMLFSTGGIAVWVTEYYLRLQYNVMSDEDLANAWSSDGMADLGMSFWMVVAAVITLLMNIVFILLAMADRRSEDPVAPALAEKVNGAIMLY